jgi:hypothetical protein
MLTPARHMSHLSRPGTTQFSSKKSRSNSRLVGPPSRSTVWDGCGTATSFLIPWALRSRPSHCFPGCVKNGMCTALTKIAIPVAHPIHTACFPLSKQLAPGQRPFPEFQTLLNAFNETLRTWLASGQNTHKYQPWKLYVTALPISVVLPYALCVHRSKLPFFWKHIEEIVSCASLASPLTLQLSGYTASLRRG